MENKILIVSNVPFWGGGENFIAETLSQLSAYYDVHYLVADERLYSFLPGDKRFKFPSSNILGQYKYLRTIIDRNKPNLILFNGGSLFYFMPFVSRKRVLYRHSTDLSSPSKWRWLYRIIMNIAYHYADFTIHVSEYSRSEQLLNKKKSVCIHNGIKVGESIQRKRNNGPLKVVYCSRLEESKGIRQIIEAFKYIDRNQAELHVLGTGSLEEWVKANASDSVNVWGFRKDVDEFYKISDAMILMSEYENCPISVLEAMSFSLPIITSGAGGIAEQVRNDYNGLIVSRTPESIRDAVLLLANNRDLCLKMGQNAFRECQEHFDIKDKVEEIHQVIDKVLRKS